MNAQPSEPPDSEQPESTLGVTDVVDIVFRRKWVVLAVTLLVAGASMLSTALQSTTYTSSASLVITTGAQTSVEAQQLLTTAQQLAKSDPVAAIAARRLRAKESLGGLLSGLSVTIPINTQLVKFSYTSPSPRVARQRVAAFVAAFREYQGQMLDRLAQASGSLDAQLATLRQQANALQAGNNATELASLTAQIANLEDKRTALLNTAPVASAVAEPAATAVRDEASLKRAAFVGVAAGLVLGVLVALGVDYLARRRNAQQQRRWQENFSRLTEMNAG